VSDFAISQQLSLSFDEAMVAVPEATVPTFPENVSSANRCLAGPRLS